MTTTPPQRQEWATDRSACLAAGLHRAAQRAGSRRDRPNRTRQALSGPVMALGSSAADLTSPSAKLARTVKASPTGPSAAGRAAGALTGRAGVANHATNPALPSIHYPMTTPGTGCELHAQISEKDSDTRHSNRACGSLAHGSPTFFTAGIQRPVRHDLLGRGATMVPPRSISPIRSGD